MPSTGTATLPGPVHHVGQGDAVTLNVTNALPAGHSLSFEVPGLSFDPADRRRRGDTRHPDFTAGAPGTYLYQSVGDGERQTAMGLYGALVVRPADRRARRTAARPARTTSRRRWC